MFDKLLSLVMYSERRGLLIVFVVLVLCGLGLPIPEDISIVASGVMVATDITTFWEALIVCMLGVLAGDSIIYWIGRLWGERLFKIRFVSKILKPSMIQTAARYSKSYGRMIIFFTRFLPGLRAPTYFFLGSAKDSYFKFLLIDGLAASISVPVWVYVGKVFGENLDYLEKLVKKMKFGSILLVLFLIALVVLVHYAKNIMLKAVDQNAAKIESKNKNKLS